MADLDEDGVGSVGDPGEVDGGEVDDPIGGREGTAAFVRLRVVNRGRSTARNVAVRILQVQAYLAAATEAALVLAAFRAPYRGRSTPVNAWWGSFDLAVNLFSGAPADPPAKDFIMRNAMDAEEVAVGWWPGDERYGRPAFFAYAHPAPAGFADARLEPPAVRWEPALGEFLLDADDARAGGDLHAAALAFARSAFQHACAVCDCDPSLSASATGTPPPVA